MDSTHRFPVRVSARLCPSASRCHGSTRLIPRIPEPPPGRRPPVHVIRLASGIQRGDPPGCDQKWRTGFTELCSVSASRTWKGARRYLGAWQAAAPAGRRPPMQQSAICFLGQMNLESRKTGTEPAMLRFSCFPAFQILSPPRVLIRARATLSRLPCPPLPIAPDPPMPVDIGCFVGFCLGRPVAIMICARRKEPSFGVGPGRKPLTPACQRGSSPARPGRAARRGPRTAPARAGRNPARQRTGSPAPPTR